MNQKFIEVALPLPIEKSFSYSVPPKFAKLIKKGMRVNVPFKNRQIIGFVLKVGRKPRPFQTRPITDIVDNGPLIDEKMFKLAKEISFLYIASLGEVLKSFLPSGLKECPKDISGKAGDLESKVTVVCKNHPESHFRNLGKELLKKIKRGVFSLNLLAGLSIIERKFLYLRLIKDVLDEGKSCLLLVPDTSFIEPLEKFFKLHFNEKEVFSFYSRLKNKEKNLRWFRSRETKCLVIGTQQSIFLPLTQLGLIIVEEEAEPSYKQGAPPHANIREVALKRAGLEKCPLILSATAPCLETFYRVKKDKKARFFNLLNYQNKINMQLVDLNRQITKPPFISKAVELKISKCLKEKKKIFIFLNRKGFSTYLHCPACNYIKRCPHCNVPLIYYYSEKKLICNFCLYREELPKFCPKCQKTYLKFSGMGIEKLESELSRIFPQAKIRTLAADKKDSSHFQKIIRDYEKGRIDILISTQILAKRFHQVRADLAILALADIGFNLPDFRTGEHLFALISQIKNLVKLDGTFIIQTFTPQAPAIKYAIKEEPFVFYEEELEARRHLNLPPYAHLIQLRIASSEKQSAQRAAKTLEGLLREKINSKKISREVEISESSPCFYSKLKGKYRWQITISAKNQKKLSALVKVVRKSFKGGSGLRVVFDAQPQDLL